MCRMEERMATLVAEADIHKAQLESSAGILGQQQQLEEAARRQVSLGAHHSTGQSITCDNLMIAASVFELRMCFLGMHTLHAHRY